MSAAQSIRLRVEVGFSSGNMLDLNGCSFCLAGLMGRHRTNLLPILKNPAAPRKGLKFRWARSTGRTPAGALMGRVEDLVDAAGQCPRAVRLLRSSPLVW